MIIFKRHIPPWVDHDPVEAQEFDNIEALLNDPWIKDWNIGQDNFTYYQSPSNGIICLLMCMWDDPSNKVSGKAWWVIGYVNKKDIGLPEWKCPEFK